jgi:hypothetical protein
MAGEAGKGSAQRPTSVSQDEWDSRWDNIFNKPECVDPTSPTLDLTVNCDNEDQEATVGINFKF